MKTKREMLKELNKNFTYREEANALTHQCFRDSFLEDLHAGKSSKLLKNPELSRITQKEMKKLMIETSANLAKFLEFKAKKPKEYKQIMKGIALMFTGKWEKKAEKYNVNKGD